MTARKQRSISCSDEQWHLIHEHAKQRRLSASEYILMLVEADIKGEERKVEDERSVRRAVWFLYADRLARLRASGEDSHIDELLAEVREKFE